MGWEREELERGWIVWTNKKKEKALETDENWTCEKESAIAPGLPAGGICVPITRLRTQMLPKSVSEFQREEDPESSC